MVRSQWLGRGMRAEDQPPRRLALAVALFALCVHAGAASAQVGALPDNAGLNTLDTLRDGVEIGEARCRALHPAIWLSVEGRRFCVRYWLSTGGGPGDEAIVFMHGDVGGRQGGRYYVAGGAAHVTAERQRQRAERRSRMLGATYIAVGRPGAYGSSGHHLRQRRTLLEVNVMTAALDAIKARHGIGRFHLVGQSGGGHTVASLLALRTDLGCAVMTSGILSVRSHARDLGWPITAKIAASHDPIEIVGDIRNRPGLRMVVISDPDDRQVPYRSQREFVERVRTRGLHVLHVMASGGGGASHELAAVGLRLAADCARGADDDTLSRTYRTKAPPPGGG